MKLEVLENHPATPNNNPPLLFIHGMFHGAWCWEPYFMPAFAKLGYKTYAVSLSNHGQSDRRKAFNLLSIDDYVEDVKSVVNTIETATGEKPILVGHSMGGYVVQKYLEKYDAPAGVLIAAVPPFGIWAATFQVLRNFPITFLLANLTLNLKRIVNHPKRFRKVLLSDNVPESEVARFMPKVDTESFRAYFDMLGLNLVKSEKVTKPLMVIAGGQDFAAPLAKVLKTAEIYNVKPFVYPEMAHNMMFEPEHETIVNDIDGWVTENLQVESSKPTLSN